MKTKILTVVLIIGCISLAILFQVNYNKISQDKSDKANDIQITYDLFKNSFHSAAVSYENKDLENAWISYGEAKYLASQVVKNIRPLLGEKEQCDLDSILYHISSRWWAARENWSSYSAETSEYLWKVDSWFQKEEHSSPFSLEMYNFQSYLSEETEE